MLGADLVGYKGAGWEGDVQHVHLALGLESTGLAGQTYRVDAGVAVPIRLIKL